MTEVPDKSQKQRKREKKNKLKALQSFLVVQKSDPSPSSEIAKAHASDHEQKTNETEDKFCNICQADLGDKKRNCGFCNWPFCSQHMRKKRKSKQTNKFARICDNCEDKYLYTKYMKLEMKNQESLAVQETIIQAARDEIESKVNDKRALMEVHRKKQKQIQQKRNQHETKWKQELNQIASGSEKLEKQGVELDKFEAELKELQSKLPPAFEQDYRTLELQSERVNKEILKYEKLCADAFNVKTKREKEIYEEYQKWQNNQRMRIRQKEQEECCIF